MEKIGWAIFVASVSAMILCAWHIYRKRREFDECRKLVFTIRHPHEKDEEYALGDYLDLVDRAQKSGLTAEQIQRQSSRNGTLDFKKLAKTAHASFVRYAQRQTQKERESLEIEAQEFYKNQIGKD